jgi:predicted ATP-dependent endonuclease of OLD family
MKLKTVHIRMFRNILDSTPVKIEEKVTCLVGKNESGKSAFLNALWRLNPARTNPAFVIHDHYPAWLEKRHRNEGVNQKDFEPVEIALEWEPADVKGIEDKMGPGVVAAGATLQVWKNYGNE